MIFRQPSRPLKLLLSAIVLGVVGVGFALQTIGRATQSAPLTAYVPQGALLTIENPDFASLLNAWNASAEQAAWLKSANYSVFSNSRLFGRLTDAQAEFETAAGLPAGSNLLKQVAGKQSIFAWYDIGNLEFLYLTRMPAGQSAQSTLLQERSKFSRRQVGENAFYVRTTPAGTQGAARTVAFATSGDWLLLATREDLIAQALRLLDRSAKDSLATEPWYQDAQEADGKASHPDLHMVLNLDRLVRTPYFRSYWVQRNITEMGQYRAAVADLYREPSRFREERVLLPKQSLPAPEGNANLAQLAALAPPGTGFYRAALTQDAAAVYATLEERLLNRSIGAAPESTDAPDPDLAVEQAGSVADLETRIDAVSAMPASAAPAIPALQQFLAQSGLDASLTLDSATVSADGLWVPFHSAVVLRATKPWDRPALESTLQQDLRLHLTVGTLGLDWLPVPATPEVHVLSGAHPLAIAVQGNLCLLANDPALLATLLTRMPTTVPPGNATLIAGFDHASQRKPYARLTGLLDRSGGGLPQASGDATPAVFSGDLRSLSDTFAAMASEQFVEHSDGVNLRQTVTYQWQK